MERARWKNTKLPIEADELPDLYEKGFTLDKSDFICVECSGNATPCSFKPENKKRPWFTIDKHNETCEVFKYKKLTKIGKKKRVSKPDGFPVPYPSKLYLQDKDIRKASEDDLNSKNTNNIKKTTTYADSDRESVDTNNHNRTSSTIRPIVKHFIDFPYDRDCKLELPMIKKDNTYNSIFRKISQYKIDIKNNNDLKVKWTDKYSTTKLYYGILSLEEDSIVKEENKIKIKLYLQAYTPIYLNIDTSDWSKRKYNEVIKEFEEAKEEKVKEFSNNLKDCMKEYKTKNNIDDKEELDQRIMDKLYTSVKTKMNKQNKNIYIFFVGNLDKNNDKIFRLYNNDFRLLYSQFCKIIYPK